MFFKLPFAVSFSVLFIYICMCKYIHMRIVVTTKEYSKNKVLNIVNVEL